MSEEHSDNPPGNEPNPGYSHSQPTEEGKGPASGEPFEYTPESNMFQGEKPNPQRAANKKKSVAFQESFPQEGLAGKG